MFNKDFYPTPIEVIETMLQDVVIKDKVVLEPSAGKCNIVGYLQLHGAKEVLACENNPDLKIIVQSYCKLIAEDFLTLESDRISHIDLIVMNPPFSAAVDHILHAYKIAPQGCKIIALCNSSNLENAYTSNRRELKAAIENYGTQQNLDNCFSDAERSTDVKVSLITIQKPGDNYNSEFEGFFLEDDAIEEQENGIMSYNVVRDLVNRYVAAIKLYDQQLELAAQMNELTHEYFFSGEPRVTMTVSRLSVPIKRNDFKKDMQKAGWNFIFNKMNMQKYTTKGVRDDINKFVEQQINIPFTMKNIYKMLEIVIGTASQRMDKAILEVFDKLTAHHHDNRFNVEGWKTNSHFLVGKKFILPYMINPATEYGYTSDTYSYLSNSYDIVIADLEKALCFVSGYNYDNIITVSQSVKRNTYGEWYDSEFFRYKGYKKGSMHFEFNDMEIWGKFNQRVAKLKGYPLFEPKKQTKHQNRQTGRATQEKRTAEDFKPTILSQIKNRIIMIPFNPELASQGRPVITRDGRKVTEIKVYKTITDSYTECISAVIDGEILLFYKNGNYSRSGAERSYDLFMEESPAETKDVWVNLYWDSAKEEVTSITYSSERIARDSILSIHPFIHLSTTHHKVPIK